MGDKVPNKASFLATKLHYVDNKANPASGELQKGVSKTKLIDSEEQNYDSKAQHEKINISSQSNKSQGNGSLRKSRSEFMRSSITLLQTEVRKTTPSALTEKQSIPSSLSSVDEKPYHKVNIPIQQTNMSIFGDDYCNKRDRFLLELRRIEEEIENFSTVLKRWYDRTRSMSSLRIPSENSVYKLCPYIQDAKGKDKALKLTFDVSQFDPSEVSVSVLNKKTLLISAKHEEKSDGRVIFREYKRELSIPRSTVPESIISCHFRDGILTIEAPFIYPREHSHLSFPSLEPSVSSHIGPLSSYEKHSPEDTDVKKLETQTAAQSSDVINIAQKDGDVQKT